MDIITNLTQTHLTTLTNLHVHVDDCSLLSVFFTQSIEAHIAPTRPLEFNATFSVMLLDKALLTLQGSVRVSGILLDVVVVHTF